MELISHIKENYSDRYFIINALLCLFGIALNMIGYFSTKAAGLDFIYLDTVGTVLMAAIGGIVPGIITGFMSNVLETLLSSADIYYGVVNIFIGLWTAWAVRRMKKITLVNVILYTVAAACIAGTLGTIFGWGIKGFYVEEHKLSLFHEPLGATIRELGSNISWDLADKFLTVAIVFVLFKLLSHSSLQKKYKLFTFWHLKKGSTYRLVECRKFSLRKKTAILLAAASLMVAVASMGIGFFLFRNAAVRQYRSFADGTTRLATHAIDPEKVDEFLQYGKAAEGYKETEKVLYDIKKSSPSIRYLYVYKIEEDGCHVVFDLDDGTDAGSAPGTVIEFDESFYPLLPKLLAGEPIDPIITDDTYGWLLTVYIPVYDSKGVCKCYVATDVAMDQIMADGYSFLMRQVIIFVGFFILILAIGQALAERSVIHPLNIMTTAASNFVYDSDRSRSESLERMKELDIATGDEVENLYHALATLCEDSLWYASDIQHKTETLSKMQNGLIMVLADIVESRDQNTGDHVRKTAAYVKVITDSMIKNGIYEDQLTEGFVSDVQNSAPLHDVGKIHVKDSILNKPGKLTDEEFAEMKSHTTAGMEILTKAIELVPESGYLEEARNLAYYHHERWDGKGYPTGLAGEAIPLSARIMAVADVFDALVSRRSYKEGFPFEKAISIIREGAGTQFDPKIAEAFLAAEETVKAVTKSFGEYR